MLSFGFFSVQLLRVDPLRLDPHDEDLVELVLGPKLLASPDLTSKSA